MNAERTIFLLNSLRVGGTETKVVRLANTLAQQGWPVSLAYLNGPDTLEAAIDDGVPTHCLQRRGPVSVPAMRRLRKYVHKVGAGTIMAFNLYPTLYASAVAWSWPRWPLRTLIGVNTTAHVSAKRRAQMAVYGPILRRADQLVFGCDAQMQLWTREYRLHGTNRTVVYNGIDTHRFRPGVTEADASRLRQRLGYSPEDLIVGTVGQLRREKAQSDLIEGVARLGRSMGNVKGLLVGSGQEESNLRSQIAEAGLGERITLLGALEDVRPALEVMDIFVLPSIVDTFSNAVLEAMAMGKPVVLSDVGGAREMVDDAATGRLYEQGNIEALTEILLELGRDSSKRRALGGMAREKVQQQFSYSRMVDDYKALLARPAAGAPAAAGKGRKIEGLTSGHIDPRAR